MANSFYSFRFLIYFSCRVWETAGLSYSIWIWHNHEIFQGNSCGKRGWCTSVWIIHGSILLCMTAHWHDPEKLTDVWTSQGASTLCALIMVPATVVPGWLSSWKHIIMCTCMQSCTCGFVVHSVVVGTSSHCGTQPGYIIVNVKFYIYSVKL